jgi:hypothetical protein
MRLSLALFLALTGVAAPPAQPGHFNLPRVSPDAAAGHLVRKVEPVYPAFARAAGLEGVVRFEVGISTYGHIYSVMKVSGPPSLEQAAEDAMGQYVYRPFEEDGRPVNVTTTVDVVFELGEGARKTPAYPVQKISMDNFTSAEAPDSIDALSPKLRLWLQSHAKTYGNGLSWLSVAEQAEAGKEWLDSLTIHELPARKAAVRLYFVRPETREACGATGNCEIELVEENATGVHAIATASGWGVYPHFRAGSLYPGIFIPSHLSGREQFVAGYVNAAGFWGLLYCGSIQTDDEGKGTADIQVCD